MDFVGYDLNPIFYIALAGLIIGFVLFMGTLFIDGPGPLAIGGFLLIIASLIGGFLLPDGTENWSKDARAEIKDHYGLTLSEKQFDRLKYPKQKEEPEGDFEQYGSVTVVKPDGDRSFEKTEVYLLWSDGEMVLAAPDEQRKLQPLKARD